MRRTFGWLALSAAIIIVAYSASTLFNSAFHSVAEPWQAWQTAIGAAAVVLWEATAVSLIGWAWHRGYRPVAVMAVPLLLLACCVSFLWESALLTAGQADHVAERAAIADSRSGAQQDLKWYRDRRDTLKTAKPSPSVVKELAWIDGRIRELDANSKISISEASPQSAWIARLTGFTKQQASDVTVVAILLFWMLARVVSVPLAVAGMSQKQSEILPETSQMLSEKVVMDRPDLSRDRQITPVVLSAGIPQKTLEIKGDAKSVSTEKVICADNRDASPVICETLPDNTNVISPPQFEGRLPRLIKTEKKSARSTGDVALWIADWCNTTADRRQYVTTQQARDSYVAWCAEHNLHPVGHRKQTRQMRATLRCAVQKDVNGAIFPGLVIARTAAIARRA